MALTGSPGVALAAGAAGAPSAKPTDPRGLAVVAYPGSTDAAWPLARAIYAEPPLSPGSLDEALARVLCGEPAPAGAPARLADMAGAVADLRGEDAPSRMLLAEVAHRLNVRALVTVRVEDGRAVARVFLPETGSFDAAMYAPDVGAASSWSAAVRSLSRTYAPAPGPASAPTLSTHEVPPRARAALPRPFYASVWFWGALGAAVLAGGGIYLATRDTGPSTIHLELQVH
jgi:hypothetical protein